MAALGRLIAAAAVAGAAVAVLLDVHAALVDVPSGVVLVVALAFLARTAIRLASGNDVEPPRAQS